MAKRIINGAWFAWNAALAVIGGGTLLASTAIGFVEILRWLA